MERCIDISKEQRLFNIVACKNAGISTVMSKLGHASIIDSKAALYLSCAKRAGVNIGGYGAGTWHYYSECRNDYETARHKMFHQVSSWIKVALETGCNSWIGIGQELEQEEVMGLSREDNTKLLLEACQLIESAGLHPCLYGTITWISTHVDLEKFTYPLWVAYYKWLGIPVGFERDCDSIRDDQNKNSMWMHKHRSQICMWQFTTEGIASTYGCTHSHNKVSLNHLYYRPEV